MFRTSISCLTAALLLPGCGSSLRYSLDTPPLALMSAKDAGIRDDRARFREIFCTVQAEHGAQFPYNRPCENSLNRLNNEARPSGRPVYLGHARIPLRIVVVPGIFGECVNSLATPFEDAIKPMADLGYSVTALDISGRSSSEANASEIRKQLKAMHFHPDERLVLIGYSKGMSDLIELLSSDDRAAVPMGSTVISLTGVVAGTPIADSGKAAYRLFWRVPLPECKPGDGGGVASLTRKHRMNFAATHPLPRDIHYFSVPAFTQKNNISAFLKGGNKALSKVDARNDGNVIYHDSIIPGSTLLAYANSDHWALSLPFALRAPKRARLFATHNDYPRVVLLEAIARSVEEHYLDGR